MSERATERDEEHPLDFPPESEVPDDLFGIILHSAWILTFARSCEWKNVRAEIDQLAKEVHRLRSPSEGEVDEDYFEHVVDDLNDGSLSINVVDERVTISVDMWNAMVGEIGRLRQPEPASEGDGEP